VSFRIGRSAAAAIVVLAAWVACEAADVDRGVIRLAEPSAAAETDETPAPPDPLSDARRGFDADAFDARLEGLWFQRKALEREGRAADVERQAGLIRDFVGEEGVRRLEAPAGALLLEAAAWLREGNTPMLYSVIQSGKSAGMQTMDEALMAHLQAGRISHHDALARAQDKTRFETPAQQPGGATAPATRKAA